MTKELETELDPQTISEAAGPRPGSMLRAMSYANLDAEKVLRGFGTFGAYQVGFLSLIEEIVEFRCSSMPWPTWASSSLLAKP